MNRLNVLFIPSWYPSMRNPLSGIFVKEHAKAVSLYNDVVVLYSEGIDYSVEGLCEITEDMEGDLCTYRLRYRKSPIPKTTYFIYIWGMIKVFRKLIEDGFKPDIIHAHIYSVGIPSLILGKLYQIPVVITEQFTGFPRRTLSREEIFKARVAMEQASLVFPVSDGLREHIEDYDIHARFQVVPNVVNSKFFYPPTSPNLKSDEVKKMLLVALLTPKKGVPYLLKALHQLNGKRSDFVLDIVGDGKNRREYEQMVVDLGLSDKVNFHGMKPKPEVAEFMRQCDFFVLPSLFETFGAVIVEALACGKPVIATDVSGPSEILTEEVGCLVPAADTDKLAEAIDYMLDHYEDYDSQKIVQYAQEKYSYEVVGKMFDNAYQSVIS